MIEIPISNDINITTERFLYPPANDIFGENMSNKRKRFDIDKATLEELYNKPLTQKQLAKICGVGQSTISGLLLKWSIPTRSISDAACLTWDTNIKREQLYTLYTEQQLSAVKCGQILGCCPGVILRLLRKHNIPIRPAAKVLLDISKDELEELYTVKQHSIRKIGEKLGYSPWTILNYLRRFDIPIRTSGESQTEELSYMHGKIISAEVRMKISKSNTGKKRSAEVRKNISKNHADIQGDKNPNWQGGTSFEPYCYKFNEELKERVREKYNRKCFLCGRAEENEKKRLYVHHVHYNKREGCDGNNEIVLVPLCGSCHSKTNYNREYWKNEILELMMEDA